jgi:hypothetical protein
MIWTRHVKSKKSGQHLAWKTLKVLSVTQGKSYDLGSVDEHCWGGGANGPCKKYNAFTLHNVVF